MLLFLMDEYLLTLIYNIYYTIYSLLNRHKLNLEWKVIEALTIWGIDEHPDLLTYEDKVKKAKSLIASNEHQN